MAAVTRARPLSARPLDLAWVSYMLMHLLPALLFDTQVYLPVRSIPSFARKALSAYLEMSNDPLLRKVNLPEFGWLKAFMGCELFFQTPVLLVASYGLWKDDVRTLPLVLLYAAHCATTTLPCVLTLVSSRSELGSDQFVMLLSAYIPYLVIPIIMSIDMLRRLHVILGNTVASGKAKAN